MIGQWPLANRWYVDGLQIPPSEDFNHLIVATDIATKYVILNKSKGETTQAVTETLLGISTRLGPPKQVTTKRGSANMSNHTASHDLGIQIKPTGTKKTTG